MCDADVSSAVVVSEDASPVGIITEQDICRRATFVVPGDAPASGIMSTPVCSIREDDHLYRAIASMRRLNLRHMPVVNRSGRVTGVLNLDDSLAEAAGQIVRHIEYLSHDSSFEGLCETKRSQKDVALELLDDAVPTP
jgi:CBS domain-containing protein